MRTLKLTLAYDGAAYRGWQRQDAGVSIQGLVEEALTRLEGAPVTIVGAGRTDAGVHALGQVARAVLSGRHEAPTVQRALNAILPVDIRVVSAEEVPETFHPRIDARSKRYQYWIWDAPVLPPAVRNWCWHVPRRLDVAAMDAAASMLVGRHDFAAFRSTGTDVATTVRTMTHAGVRALPAGDDPSPLARRLVPSDGRFVVLDVEADGFLRHMVRAIAGTLVEVGEGRRDPSSIPDVVASGDRHQAGATAPPEGLVLVKVTY
jgi:tRNA pseudouridine38-40 synthase